MSGDSGVNAHGCAQACWSGYRTALLCLVPGRIACTRTALLLETCTLLVHCTSRTQDCSSDALQSPVPGTAHTVGILHAWAQHYLCDEPFVLCLPLGAYIACRSTCAHAHAAARSCLFSVMPCTPLTLCRQRRRLDDVPLVVQVPMHWMNCSNSPAQKKGASNCQPPPKPPPRRQQPAPPAPEVSCADI